MGKVAGRAYVVSGLWLPEANVLAGKPDDITSGVHDASTGPTSTDIDTHVVIQKRVKLMVWVDRQLSRLLSRSLPVRLAEWHRAHDGRAAVSRRIRMCERGSV